MLKSFLNKLNYISDKKILVIGDLMVDEYQKGKVNRISPEAPVPVVNIKESIRVLGGAGNVVNNLCSFGAKVKVCGIIGNDEYGLWLENYIRGKGIETELIIRDSVRPTIVKSRVMAGHHQMIRLDWEDTSEVSGDSIKKALNDLAMEIGKADVIVISDYCKGFMTGLFSEEIVAIAYEKGIPILVDTKAKSLAHYKGATIVTPNLAELEGIYGDNIKDERKLYEVGEEVRRNYSLENLLVTRSEQGMTLFSVDHKPVTMGTLPKQVFDVTGAGDTVLSAFAIGLASELNMIECMLFATLAAGIVIGKAGTATTSLTEIMEISEDRALQDFIYNLDFSIR